MKINTLELCLLSGGVLASLLLLSGCGRVQAGAEAPPPATVIPDMDLNLLTVDHPEQFVLSTTTVREAASELVVTGAVLPDISRNVPVVSLASGRVVDIRARLGDTVKKGQILLRVRSDDMSGAAANYRKALADETLAHSQLDRAQELYSHGAIALNDFQVAQDAEAKAKVDVETTAEHLHLLGSNIDHPSNVVDILAPVSGVITDQQITNSAGVQALSSNPFTISDLSHVWILCDVYENDLPSVRVGDIAEIRLNAYPGIRLRGIISNIGSVLDPSIRSAKVRIEVVNPGVMRVGMYVTAVFRGKKLEAHTTVPTSAILHLHDRDWVYVATPDKKFRRVEVVSGQVLPDNMQDIKAGLQAGQQVVAKAVVLEHVVEEK